MLILKMRNRSIERLNDSFKDTQLESRRSRFELSLDSSTVYTLHYSSTRRQVFRRSTEVPVETHLLNYVFMEASFLFDPSLN